MDGMVKAMDARVIGTALYFLPVTTRVPLKFGPETLTQVTCARVCVRVADGTGRTAEGWGETPLSVQWVWPSRLSYEARHARLKGFAARLAQAWADFGAAGHPVEIGYDFKEQVVPALLDGANRAEGPGGEPMPYLAAVVCCSPFDIALHVEWLSTDFNCTVTDPAYVTTLLDRLRDEHPRVFGMVLYVEQPFPSACSSIRQPPRLRKPSIRGSTAGATACWIFRAFTGPGSATVWQRSAAPSPRRS